MGLVDLRRREDEEAVRVLLAFAHGSPESAERAAARYATREWILVGWEDDGELVACAGMERNSESEIRIRSVATLPERRGRGVGRALVEAIAGVASVSRLVAETDDDAVGFYRRCGFGIEEIEPKDGRPRFRCSREIETLSVAPAAVRAFTLSKLESAIRGSWGRDTSDDPDEWSESNPARGQCAVTAMLVRELLGGEILIANVLRDGRRIERHAWNLLPSGLVLDLTRSQFARGEEFEAPVPGEPIIVNPAGYELFAVRVREKLSL